MVKRKNENGRYCPGVAGRRVVSLALWALACLALMAAAGGPLRAEEAEENVPDATAVNTDPLQPVSTVYQVKADENLIELKVTLDKSETVRLSEAFAEALVGNAEVADVVPLTDRSIYILGKKVGVTRISLLNKDKRLIGTVDVEVTYDIKALKARLQEHVPHAHVQVDSVNGKMLLTGVVPDAPTLARVESFAKQIAPGEITNALTVAAPQQVKLEVRFVEVSRSAARGLGVNGIVQGDRAVGVTGDSSDALILSNQQELLSAVLVDTATGLASNAIPFGSAVGRLIDAGVKVDVLIQALEERDLARRLAEPNLSALSGDTASFLAGGEFPFPVAAEDDKITVEFKKFGVGLAFTPTVLADGQINLKVEPEVSELDPTNFVKINDFEIPSLVVRRAQTTVELRDGQSFMIAGLLQTNHTKAQRQLPWIGQVPVLGTLFRSASFQKAETDLVIIVTPRLVKPRVPGEKLKTPLDDSVPSNDREFFLEGKQEIAVNKPTPGYGHILDLVADEPAIREYEGLK